MIRWLIIIISVTLLTACQLVASNNPVPADDSAYADAKVVDDLTSEQLPSIDAEILAADNLDTAPVITPVIVTAQQEADLWVRIQRQLSFIAPEHQRVVAQRNWYLRNPAYMERVAKRAAPFMYMIVEEIERRQMPLDLALLPIVESAFDPFAYSHGRAAGIWQFIPGTARNYGLEINWWYDGRRDVLASTHAALDYLEALHKRFDGDWLHALAAYNSGEGRVERAIRANARAGKATDFWALDLPRETRAYVPKLLALADILKHHERYQYSWTPIDNQAYLVVVEVASQIDLATAAEQAGLSLKQLHHYNSGYNRWATDPQGPHRLLLPIAHAHQLQQWLARADRSEFVQWTRHQVKSGESLLVIAKQYHTTVDAIRTANELRGNLIRAGDFLLIPVATRDLAEYSLSADQRLAATQATNRGNFKIEHRVVAGDTLWDISRKYDVNLRSLASWNGMAPTDPLRPGKNLVVWLPQQQAAGAVMRSIQYQVRSGDSLARIADRFNVTIADIEKWNQINRRKHLQPGQRLKLYVDVTRINSQS